LSKERKKVCIVLTARGNYAKMKSVISALDATNQCEVTILVGGSVVLDRYGKLLDDPNVDPLVIQHKIHFLVEGETPLTMAKSAGLAVSEFATAFENTRPDIILVIADRYESLAIAMAATYMNIAVAHVEGGEISGSIDESIRHAITKLAHLHFPATEDAADRIIRMGEDPNSVFCVGSTSIDVLADLDLSNLSAIQDYQKTHGVGPAIPLVSGKYLIVAQHPVTTEYDQNYLNVQQIASAISELQLPTVWLWPNMDAGSDGVSKAIRELRENMRPDHIHFFKSLPIELFGPLMKNAGCIVGNSSSGIREASFLGLPSVNVGSRQNGRERGENVIDVACEKRAICQAISKQLEHGHYSSATIYGDGAAGTAIARTLLDAEVTQQKTITY